MSFNINKLGFAGLLLDNTTPPTGRPATPKTANVEDTLKNPDTEDLNRFSVEKQVKWCRPDNAPLDQLLRMLNNNAPTKSQRFDFWAATQNSQIYAITNATLIANSDPQEFTITLSAAADDLLEDDVLASVNTTSQGYSYNALNGQVVSTPDVPLILQITGKTNGTTYTAIAVNQKDATTPITVAGQFFCIGNAKNEEDVLNEAYNQMPKKDANYAQRFMNVVSETDYQALIDKEAVWGLQQYRMVSMYNFRMKLELALFTGIRRKIEDATHGEVYFTGGLDDFLRNRVIQRVAQGTNLSLQDIQNWGRDVFTNSNGSSERYMFVSPIFMQEILKIPQLYTANNTILRVTDAVDLQNNKLGFSVRKLDTGYGIINLVLHKGLSGRRDNRGYIVDISNIRRRTLEPATAVTYDLEKLLIKKAKAIVLQECSGIEVQNIETMGIVELNSSSSQASSSQTSGN